MRCLCCSLLLVKYNSSPLSSYHRLVRFDLFSSLGLRVSLTVHVKKTQVGRKGEEWNQICYDFRAPSIVICDVISFPSWTLPHFWLADPGFFLATKATQVISLGWKFSKHFYRKPTPLDVWSSNEKLVSLFYFRVLALDTETNIRVSATSISRSLFFTSGFMLNQSPGLVFYLSSSSGCPLFATQISAAPKAPCLFCQEKWCKVQNMMPQCHCIGNFALFCHANSL